LFESELWPDPSKSIEYWLYDSKTIRKSLASSPQATEISFEVERKVKEGQMLMNKQKIINFVLQEGEGYKVEFKESISHISREMVAFANASGSRIFIGIMDNHEIKGIKIDERLKSQIQDIAINCDPPVKILLEAIPYKNKEVLSVDVFEGDNKPYSCSEGFFIRNGPITGI